MAGFFNAITQPTGGDSDHSRYRAMDKLSSAGKAYVSHQGKAQKLRRLRQCTRGLQLTIEQEFRVNTWLKTAPGVQGVDAEFARMMTLNYALCSAEDLGLPFHDVMDDVLDKLEREASHDIVRALTGGQA